MLLPVHGGALTRVDPDVAAHLGARRLRAHSRGYVWVGRTLLHHLVLGRPAPGLVTDHINGDKTDNRRCNLRHVSPERNGLNRHKVHGGIPWRGVRRHRARCIADASRQGRYAYVGTFATPLVAALARDDALRRRHRWRDGLNFPHFVHRADVPGLLATTCGQLFHVWFVRRSDGRLRSMTARTGVAKDLKGKALAFNPTDRDLMSVFDVQRGAYRFIPLENVLCLTCNGKRFRVVA